MPSRTPDAPPIYTARMRLVTTILVQLIANAIALIVAAALLENMTLHLDGFFIAVGLFTVLTIIVSPAVRRATRERSAAVVGSSSLITSLLALIGTSWLSKGLQIHGLGTWILAAVIVWFAGLVCAAILPRFLFTGNKDD